MSKVVTDLKNEIKNMPYISMFINNYLRIPKNPDDEALTIQSIRGGVEFKGASLWILIFAIFVASLGLNVNSTAVIIGAMLISPLMGPIMGIGLAIGISDFDLLKKSMKNLLVATIFSIITSTIYFSLTPIDEAQSELLARTSPTIYDVMIALFGGLAGIVALFTKDKGNVIPGVAIATALMPPLCTAGFGLATGNFIYFLGAFYLYFINSVFISLATFIGIRVMKFNRVSIVNPERGRMVKRYMIIVILFTMCPAIYLTYGLVKKTIYMTSVNNYITQELDFPDTQVIDKRISYENRSMEVVLMGKEVSDENIAKAKDKLKNFNLAGTKLTIFQGMGGAGFDVSTVKAQIMEDFYKNSELRLTQQQKKIDSLKNELRIFAAYNKVDRNIIPEIKVLYPEATSFAMAKAIEMSMDSAKIDTITLALMNFKRVPGIQEQQKITKWLEARLNAKQVRLIIR